MSEQYGPYHRQFPGTKTGTSSQQQLLDDIRGRKEFGDGFSHFIELFKKHDGTDIHFLIDGSGSMSSKPPGMEQTPLNEAMTVAYTVTRGAQESRTGTTVSTTLYGDNSKTPPQFSLEDSRVEKVQDFFNSVCHGLHCGSDLNNEIDALSDVMADIAPERKQEIIVLTDGDLFTRKETVEKLLIIKELHPGANISIYALSASQATAVGKIAEDLAVRGIDVDYQTQMTAEAVLDEISAKVSGKAPADRKLKAVLKAASEVRTAFADLTKKMEKLDDKIADYEGKPAANRNKRGFGSLNGQGRKF